METTSLQWRASTASRMRGLTGGTAARKIVKSRLEPLSSTTNPITGGRRWNSRYFWRNTGSQNMASHGLQMAAAYSSLTGSSGGRRVRISRRMSSGKSGGGGGGGASSRAAALCLAAGLLALLRCAGGARNSNSRYDLGELGPPGSASWQGCGARSRKRPRLWKHGREAAPREAEDAMRGPPMQGRGGGWVGGWDGLALAGRGGGVPAAYGRPWCRCFLRRRARSKRGWDRGEGGGRFWEWRRVLLWTRRRLLHKAPSEF